MYAEDVLKSRVEQVHGELHPGKALDVTAIIAIITAIMEAFRGCRNPETAKAHVRRGSAIAVLAARKAILRNGYQGDALAFARKLVQHGPTLSEQELNALVQDANDIPQPPPAAGGSWPTWSAAIGMLLVLGLSGPLLASWPVGEAEQTIDASWPVSIAETPEAKTPEVEMPAPRLETPRVSPPVVQGKPVIPAARQWEFAGDTGPESLRRHLLDPHHRSPIMRWLGTSSVAEYEAELAKLSYSELKQLHSADHEHLTRGQARFQTTSQPPQHQTVSHTTRKVPASSDVVRQAQPVAVRSPAPRQTTSRRGLFGRVYTMPLYQRIGCPSGGCP